MSQYLPSPQFHCVGTLAESAKWASWADISLRDWSHEDRDVPLQVYVRLTAERMRERAPRPAHHHRAPRAVRIYSWEFDTGAEAIAYNRWRAHNAEALERLATALVRRSVREMHGIGWPTIDGIEEQLLRSTIAALTHEQADTAGTATTRIHSRIYEAPNALADLTGAATGTLRLPPTLTPDGEQQRVDLADTAATRAAYETIIRLGTAVEQADLLREEILINLWPTMTLPWRARVFWEESFPELPRSL